MSKVKLFKIFFLIIHMFTDIKFLKTAFVAHHKFWYVEFPFSLVSRFFLAFKKKNVFFNFHIFVNFPIF